MLVYIQIAIYQGFYMRQQFITCLLLFLFSVVAMADGAGYSGYHEIAITSSVGSFRHVHDWSKRSKPYKWSSDITQHEKFFSQENDFSYVEFIDYQGKVKFRAPSPAFTKLAIIPSKNLLIGLSELKLNNPYQIVVWKSDGTLLHREHVSSSVVVMSDELRADFTRLFPNEAKWLANRYFTYNNVTYLDYGVSWSEHQREALKYLVNRRSKHPYGVSESVSNWVYWFSDCDEVSADKDSDQLYLVFKRSEKETLRIPLQVSKAADK